MICAIPKNISYSIRMCHIQIELPEAKIFNYTFA